MPALAAKQRAALLQGGLARLAVRIAIARWAGWRGELAGYTLAAGCPAGAMTGLLGRRQLFAGAAVALAPAQRGRGELLQTGGQVGRSLILAAGQAGLLVLASRSVLSAVQRAGVPAQLVWPASSPIINRQRRMLFMCLPSGLPWRALS